MNVALNIRSAPFSYPRHDTIIDLITEVIKRQQLHSIFFSEEGVLFASDGHWNSLPELKSTPLYLCSAAYEAHEIRDYPESMFTIAGLAQWMFNTQESSRVIQL